MAVTTDILATWRRPAALIRRRLETGRNEAAALAVLLGACFLFFVARWPALARQAHLAQEAGLPPDQAPGLQALLGINLFALIFVAPLAFYLLATLLHGAMRAAGSRIDGYAVRLSLFWALLAVSPAVLFQGLLAGIKGPGPALTAVGLLVMAAFLWLAMQMLREAARMARGGPEAKSDV